MSGHYESIGVEYTREGLEPLIRRACTSTAPRRHADGGSTWVWRDVSGASVVVRADADGEVVCAAPSFDAASRIPAVATAVVDDPECRFCSTALLEVLHEGEMVTTLAAELENIEVLLDGGLPDDLGVLALTAFGEEVQVWADEAAFEETPGVENLAVRSFVPMGTFAFDDVPVRAAALLTGVVEASSSLRNGATGRPFVHAAVATYEMTVDCVFGPDDVPAALAPGNVVQGSFWLIGRLLPA